MPKGIPVKFTSKADGLSDEDLRFLAMDGTEEISRLFDYTIDLLSPRPDLEFEALLGKHACVELETEPGDSRYFHGFVTDVAQTGRAGRYVSYRVHLRPWLWFLTRSADCRIFQDKTVPDIIKQVFAEHGFPDEVKLMLQSTYDPWVYCVQYRETAFNFVSRLMEAEGIYYYFTHEADKHLLVVTDSYSGHDPLPSYPKIPYYAPAQGVHDEHVFDWYVTKSVQTGTVELLDYDFTKPGTNLTASSDADVKHEHAKYKVFDYPGDYELKKDGDNYARARIEEIQAQYERVRGVCDVRGVCAGGLFTLEEHPRDDQNREYLVVSSRQHISIPGYESGGDEAQFQCRFEAIDSKTPFRAARLTPRPVIQGPQTAVVVGAEGSEIHTDKYARVKVKFHWDRLGEKENCSCWVRVSQSVWAGKTWGAMNIPRVGQEVIVEFLEGDPDQPIITGRVYNAENMPPYELPGNATMSGLKSNSSPGGEGFNELRFEDKKDEEQIFIHAQKNMDIRVLNDRFETVLKERHLVVGTNKKEHVKNDREETIDGHQKETIAKDRNLTVSGKEAKKVAKELSLTVDGAVTEKFADKHSETVTKDYYLKAKNIVIEGTTNVTVKVGDSFIAIQSDGIKIGTKGKIVLDAMNGIEATTKMDVKMEGKTGVEIKGLKVDVKGDTTVTLDGQAQATVKSTGITEIKGSLVKIN